MRPMSERRIRTHLLHSGFHKSSMSQFLMAILLLLVGFPFFSKHVYSQQILSAMLTLVYVTALFAVGGESKKLVQGLVLLIPAVAIRWCNHFQIAEIPEWALAVCGIFLIAFVISHLFGFISKAPQINAEVLQAGIATYLMLGVLWAFAYMLVSELSITAFSVTTIAQPAQPLDFHSALYFSFITLLSVGYGDVLPVLPVARMLAMSEAIVGCFFMALVVARLVAQYNSAKALLSGEQISDE